jgi:hypothetical protein
MPFISKHFFWIPPDSGKIFDSRNKDAPPRDRSLANEIDIYEDQVNEWFFRVGEQLDANRDADFVILQLAVSQIEGIQQLREGYTERDMLDRNNADARSGRLVKDWVRDHVDDCPLPGPDALWKAVRCGMFHTGFIGRHVLLSGPDEEDDYVMKEKPVTGGTATVYINPSAYLGSCRSRSATSLRGFAVMMRR